MEGRNTERRRTFNSVNTPSAKRRSGVSNGDPNQVDSASQTRRATSSSDFAVRLVVIDDHHDLIGLWVTSWSRLPVT